MQIASVVQSVSSKVIDTHDSVSEAGTGLIDMKKANICTSCE